MLDGLRQLLSWLFGPVQDVIAGHVSWLQIGGIAVTLAAIAAAGWFIVRVIGSSLVRESSLAATRAVNRRDRSDRLWQEAQELAASGQLARAVRAMYLSALYALEEHDVLRVEDALTNREHATRLSRSRPGAGDAFAAVVQRYDPLRYGSRSITQDAFDELRASVEHLRVASA